MTLCFDCNAAPAGARVRSGDDSYAFSACLECVELGWIGHPRCESPGEDEQFLIEHREMIELVAQIEDKDASYSYDEWAVIQVSDDYYLLSTSGCSCPSPSETWLVEMGPCRLSEIRAEIERQVDWSVPAKQREEFIAAIDAWGQE